MNSFKLNGFNASSVRLRMVTACQYLTQARETTCLNRRTTARKECSSRWCCLRYSSCGGWCGNQTPWYSPRHHAISNTALIVQLPSTPPPSAPLPHEACHVSFAVPATRTWAQRSSLPISASRQLPLACGRDVLPEPICWDVVTRRERSSSRQRSFSLRQLSFPPKSISSPSAVLFAACSCGPPMMAKVD